MAGGVRKKLLREIAGKILPASVVEAPKRPVQTPQREWLRGSLRDWADDSIALALKDFGGVWLDEREVKREWESFCAGASDNSFYIWQWISLALSARSGKNYEKYEYAARIGDSGRKSRQAVPAR